jgi:DNA-binding CsgD family transcriptional regulator
MISFREYQGALLTVLMYKKQLEGHSVSELLTEAELKMTGMIQKQVAYNQDHNGMGIKDHVELIIKQFSK